MTLTEPLRTALANLQRRASGRDVDWLNIADARALVELGLRTWETGGPTWSSSSLIRRIECQDLLTEAARGVRRFLAKLRRNRPRSNSRRL